MRCFNSSRWLLLFVALSGGGFSRGTCAGDGDTFADDVSLGNCTSQDYDANDINDIVCVDSSLCSGREHRPHLCQCDEECSHYGDCCIDAPSQEPPTTVTNLECHPTNELGVGYYMVTSCPDDFPNGPVRSSCEEPNSSDYLSAVPVTVTGDQGSDIAPFRNMFCAICNSQGLDKMVFWKMRVECAQSHTSPPPGVNSTMADGVDDGASFDGPDDGASFDALDDGASFDGHDDGASFRGLDDGASFDGPDDGASLDGTDDGASFDGPADVGLSTGVLSLLNDSSCKKVFQYPSIPNPYRMCTVIDVSHFIIDNSRRVDCPIYRSPYRVGATIYRNRGCAACNSANVTFPACNALPGRKFRPQGTGAYFNLFLYSDGYSEASCGPGEFFDAFSSDCRSIVPEYIQDDDQINAFVVYGLANIKSNTTISCANSGDIDCQQIEEIISVSLLSMISDSIPEFEGSFNISVINCTVGYKFDHCVSGGEVVLENDVIRPYQCQFEGSVITGTLSELFGALHESVKLENESLRSEDCDSPSTRVKIKQTWLTSGDISCKNPAVAIHARSIGFVWVDEQMATEIIPINGSCSEVCKSEVLIFRKSEVILNETHVWIRKRDQHFEQGRYYLLHDGSVGICADFLEGSRDSHIEEIQIILTYIGGSLSIAGLIATALTYMIFRRLRNNMGKSILSLVLSLLVAQVFQIALWDMNSNEDFCTFVAMVTHYTYLATFFWTSVLGFYLSRTFGNTAKMQTVRDSKKVFCYFSLYAWGGPTVIVAVCAVIHFSDSLDDVPFWYGARQGGTLCWIGNHTGLLLAFAAPVAMILLANVIFFTDTVIGILRARLETKRATSSNPGILNRDWKIDVLLFCKLSCIMGLSWLFGIVVAIFPDVIAIQFIFIVLNSSLGVFIFIAFGCNDRVIEIWRTEYSKSKSMNTRTNSMAAIAKISVSSAPSNQIRQKKDSSV